MIKILILLISLSSLVLGILIGALWEFSSVDKKEREEVEDMAVVYATLIVKGLKTIDQVPAKIKNQVQEILDALEV